MKLFNWINRNYLVLHILSLCYLCSKRRVSEKVSPFYPIIPEIKRETIYTILLSGKQSQNQE